MAERDVVIDITANDKTGVGVRSAERNFDKLRERVSRTNRHMVDDASKAGRTVGVAFGKNIHAFVLSRATAITPVLAGVGLAAAPVIGATISSAIIGGAGIGGVVGGVILASKDTRVQSAAKSLGDMIMSKLEQSSVVFVEPIRDALVELRGSFVRSSTDIERILRKSSTFVRPLTQGASYAFERILSGVNKLVQSATPVITALRDGMANVGEAVEDVFDSLSDNGIDAAAALNVAFGILEVTIRTVGVAVNVLTEAFGFLAKAGAFGKDVALQYRAMEISAKHAKEENEKNAGSLKKVRDSAADATVKIREYNEIVNEGRATALSQAEAQVRASIAFRETTAQIKENNKEIKNSKERTDANNLALIEFANQLETARKATEKMYGAGKQSTQVAEQNRAAFIKAARAAGYTAQEAENLADKYLGIPPKVDTKANFDKAAADRKITELEKRLAGIPDQTVNIYVGVKGLSKARAAIISGGGGGFDAVSHFYAADSSSTGRTSRTGGPTPVSVTSNVRVDLDGKPFREYTQRAINDNEDRRRWRDRVGVR